MTNQADKADRGVNRNGHEGEPVAVVDLDWSQAFGPLETSCMSKEFKEVLSLDEAFSARSQIRLHIALAAEDSQW